jgi:class 3 adenylate cyclase/tetratricopeptide (TPR) repeat protein
MSRNALCPTLVRREDQLAILEEAMLAARRGEGRFVVVSGEAGIGKTRLVTELSRMAIRLEDSVLWGGCSEADLSLPYLPFVEAVGNQLAAEDLEDFAARLGPSRAPLGQLFPQLSDGGAPERETDPAQVKLRLFEAMVTLLATLAERRPVVLVIEDVHWADDSTRGLLDHLARRVAALPLLLLVTYRSDELHRRHPFQPTLLGWKRSGLAEIVDLEPLPDAGITEMVAAILGTSAVDRELSELLYQRSEGNPFVLEEMLREAIDESGGELGPTSFEADRVPETVRDSILLRLARLEAGQAQILESAAVLGRTFEYPMLMAVAEAGETEVHGALQSATAEQLIVENEERPGRYMWRHALTQEAIYGEIVTPRRQAIHARAADALSAAEDTRPVDLANHLLGAGRFDAAVPVCLESAEEAEASVAFGEAIAMLERTLPHLGDELDRARIICRIGTDHTLNGESAAGVQFLTEGVTSLERLGESLEAARARVALGRSLWEGAKPDEARAEFDRAREVLEPEGPSAELAMVHMRLAGLDAFQLDYKGCLEHSRRAAEIAEQAGADFERVWALGFVALGLLDSGDHEHGFRVMDECFDEAVEKGYWVIANNMTFNDIWTRTHMLEGDLEPRLERFEWMPRMRPNLTGHEILSSYVGFARGDLEGAREAGQRAWQKYEDQGYEKMVWRSRVQLATVLTEMGRAAEANDVLPDVSARTELQDLVYDGPAQIRTRVALGDDTGALELANEIVESSAGLAAYRETLALAAEVLVAGGHDGVETLIEKAEARETNAGHSYLDEMRGRLLLASDDPEAAAPLLAVAEEAAERVGYPLVALRRGVLHAEAIGRTGDGAEAERRLNAIATDADRRRAVLIRSEADAAAARLGISLPPSGDPEPDPGDAREPVASGERLVTSLFADVRDYTQLSTQLAPEELEQRMASLYRFARAAVTRQNGIVDKFAGDAIMATFNVSGTRVEHSAEALEAALALLDKARLIELDLGVGIAVGPAIVSPGASDDNVSVRGESTNLAARLQGAAGGGEILLSEELYRRVADRLESRGLAAERELLDLKGLDAPTPVYRVAARVGGKTAP